MKKLLIATLFLFVSQGWSKVYQCKVEGMSCQSCVGAITKQLKANADVTKVDVDIESKMVKVEVADGSDFAKDKMKADKMIGEKIKAAGYTFVSSTELK